jgi:hypothetical protein
MNKLSATRHTSTCSLPTPLSVRTLAEQNNTYRGRGAVSAENRGQGFRPAFLDQTTGVAYLSCFANGCAAPLHILDGLPEELVVKRDPHGRVTTVKAGIIAGFLHDGVFYTREQAALALPFTHKSTRIYTPAQQIPLA